MYHVRVHTYILHVRRILLLQPFAVSWLLHTVIAEMHYDNRTSLTVLKKLELQLASVCLQRICYVLPPECQSAAWFAVANPARMFTPGCQIVGMDCM